MGIIKYKHEDGDIECKVIDKEDNKYHIKYFDSWYDMYYDRWVSRNELIFPAFGDMVI